MNVRVLIAHARGEEDRAEELAGPIRDGGFEVAHRGTVLVGDSVVAEASNLLNAGGPVVLCGTIRALGTKWARKVLQAARAGGCSVFCVRMEEEADVEALSFDEQVADYWRDPARATRDLVAALRAAYPADEKRARQVGEAAAETRYRQLALESCDIVDLAQLPESDRHVATRRLELRRLYVPLNVIVEARGDAEDASAGLGALESGRLRLKGWPGVVAKDTGEWRRRLPCGGRLAAARRLVVLGDPGAGKTTLLRWIATAYLLRLKRDPAYAQLPAVETLPEVDWLPIVIRCRDLTAECASGALDDILDHTLRKAELAPEEAGALRRLLRRRLEEGSAILLVDGLDEITDPRLRARFAQQLEQVHVAFPRAPVVVTSRIVGYRDMGYRIGRGFEHVTVSDFTLNEKDDFARRWCALTELPERVKIATEELIADIHSTDRVERLTGNPMLLTTMALVKRKIGRLPSRRADLYWEALQVLLNWRREVDQPLEHRETVPQLEYVAYEMCARGVQHLREDEVLRLLDDIRAEYPQLHDVHRQSSLEFLRALEARTGILVHAGFVRHGGRPMPLYEFRHLTFQEYLAGLALVDRVYPARAPDESVAAAIGRIAAELDEKLLRREPVTRESWREAIRVAVVNAKHDEADPVLRAVLGADEGPGGSVRARAVLAAFCLADEPKVSEAVARETLLRLASAINDSDRGFSLNTALHEASRAVMGSRWGEALREVLVDAFLTREPSGRGPIGNVLGTALGGVVDGARLTSQGYLEAARTSDRSAISTFLAATWRRLHERDLLIDPLVEIAVSAVHRSAPAVHARLLFLSRLGHASPFRSQPDYAMPAWEERHSKRIGTLLRSYWYDAGVREPGIKLVATCNLCEFRPDAEVELFSTSADHRHAAVQAIACIGNSRSVEPLVQCLEDKDMNVRRAAADALGKIGDVRAFEPLVKCFDCDHPEVRVAAAGALGKIGDARAVEPLVKRLEDKRVHVRSAAIKVLGQIGGAGAVEPLVKRLEDVDKNVRYAAAQVLGETGDPRAVKPLLARLSREDHVRPRVAAALALARLGDVRGVEYFRRKVYDPDLGLRRGAVEVLTVTAADDADRLLLTGSLDGHWPFVDPQEPITEQRVERAAQKLNIPAAEIRARYRVLAPRFGLVLEFSTDHAAPDGDRASAG
jgi:HEAT repeat protein